MYGNLLKVITCWFFYQIFNNNTILFFVSIIFSLKIRSSKSWRKLFRSLTFPFLLIGEKYLGMTYRLQLYWIAYCIMPLPLILKGIFIPAKLGNSRIGVDIKKVTVNSFILLFFLINLILRSN